MNFKGWGGGAPSCAHSDLVGPHKFSLLYAFMHYLVECAMAAILNDIVIIFKINSPISEPLICCFGCCPLSQSRIHMLPTFHFGTSI